jgi:glucan phosphoethanolaminetransferase (alkaline phosphatase superfamily)
MDISTNGIGIFLVNVFVALVVFIGLLIFTLRGRSLRPVFRILILALIVVVCGMSFARITYGIGVPW